MYNIVFVLHNQDIKENQLVSNKEISAETDIVLFQGFLWTKGAGYLQSFSSPDCWDMYRGPFSSMGSRANVNLAFSYVATVFPSEPFIIFSFLSPPCLSPYHRPQKHFSYPIPISLKCCAFVWGCRGNGLIFHGTLYLMAVNSLNGAYQHNQINYLLRRWQYYRLWEKYTKWWNRNYLFVSTAKKFNLFKSEVVFQRVRKRLTFSSWGVQLLRKWWQRGGCQRWPQRSSPCGPFVSLAPLRQACEWLLLKNITMRENQTKKV